MADALGLRKASAKGYKQAQQRLGELGAPESAPDDHARLQGTWVCVETLRNGAPVATWVGVKALFDGDNLTWFYPRSDGTYSESKCQYTIDSAAQPRHFDWHALDAPQKVDQRLYKVDGDTLRMATDLSFKSRPVSFEMAVWRFKCVRVPATNP